MQKDLSHHSINELTLLKQKENANDSTTSTWQGPKNNTEPFFAVRRSDSEKDNNSRTTKNTTTRLTRKQVGGSTTGRGETCRQLRQGRLVTWQTASSSSSHWDQTNWKTSNWNSQESSSPYDWYGVCSQYTHKYSTYRVVQHDHTSSREHAWLKSCKAKDCTSIFVSLGQL